VTTLQASLAHCRSWTTCLESELITCLENKSALSEQAQKAFAFDEKMKLLRDQVDSMRKRSENETMKMCDEIPLNMDMSMEVGQIQAAMLDFFIHMFVLKECTSVITAVWKLFYVGKKKKIKSNCKRHLSQI